MRYRARPAADALEGVSLEAPRGAITAVVGPNGSGKSTLVRALIGRVPLRDGRVTIDGRPLSELPASRLRATRGGRHAARGARLSRAACASTSRSDAFRTSASGTRRDQRTPPRSGTRCATAGVEELAARRIDTLSGGEWQRVRLARALAQGGDVLVLDEPTTFLDIGHEMAVFELLERLARDGQAVLLVSHQLNLVARFASHMVLLDHGRVVADGRPADVMKAAVLERVYQWPVSIAADPIDGAPTVVLRRSR